MFWEKVAVDSLSWRGRSLPGIALGTVQLGLPYGIANTSGQPDFQLACEIVRTAWEKGIRCFDTAQAYGESEKILGQALRGLDITGKAQVITKLGPELQSKSTEEIFSSLKHSRDLLGVPELFGVMLHRGGWLRDWQKYGPALRRLQEDGVVSFVGVSIYTETEIGLALELPEINLIQLPFNAFDQRADRLKWFDRAGKKEKLIFIRSVFLQGLLLMPPDSLSPEMEFARRSSEKFDSLCRKYRLNQAALALGYVKNKSDQSVILMGAEKPEQVMENCRLFQNINLPGSVVNEIDQLFAQTDPRIINPSLWPV